MNTVKAQRNTTRLALRGPRVTEKSANATTAKNPVYTFVVDPRSNKSEIIKEIKAMYKVTPIKVNIINVMGKKVNVRGRAGTKASTKKAMVYLKAGDSINLG